EAVAATLRLELGGGKARSSEILSLRSELLAKYQFEPKFAFAATSRPKPVTITAPASPTEWPHYRGNPQLHGLAAGRIGTAPTLAWTFQSKGEILSSPT